MILLSAKEVASRLGLSADHVRYLWRSGALPFIWVGNRRFMTDDMFNDWLRRSCRDAMSG